jgi:NitT/TauT family transport system permease protein
MMAAMIVAALHHHLRTLAAKSRRAELVLVRSSTSSNQCRCWATSPSPSYSCPLFPGRVAGAEAAAIFAIFTSQAWNMTFSFYQSLRTVPRDLEEATHSFRFSAWQRFWRLEVPLRAVSSGT